MAGTRLNRKGGPSKKPNLSNAFTSDFCDFQTKGVLGSPSDGELDSDTEDAIYASMYFDATSSNIPGTSSANHSQLETSSLEGFSSDVWNVSLTMSSSSPELDGLESKISKKGNRKRRRKSKGKQQAKKPRLLDTSEVEVIDLTTEEVEEVVDLTGDAEVLPGEAEVKPAAGKKKKTKSGLGESEGGNVIKAKKGTKRKGSASPEADIKILFEEKPAGSRKSSLTESEEGGVESLSTSGQSSSVESGELPASGGRSRVNSDDMELCSDNSPGEVIDDWKVNEKDQLGREAYERLHEQEDSAGRYYGNPKTKCTNCKQRGHAGKNCPWPKRHTVCYLCAGLNHVSSGCPMSLCPYCYQPKHRGSSCRVPGVGLNTVCTRCYMKGHYAGICPDLWRQYHHTTYQSVKLETIPGNLQRSGKKVFCCNCSQKGHYGFECTRTPPRGNPSPHLPLVAKYDLSCWPPRDRQSLRIIERALALSRPAASPSSTTPPSNRATPPEGGRGLLGKRPSHLEAIKESCDEADYTPDSKRSNRSSKKSRRRRHRSGSEPDLNRSHDEMSTAKRSQLLVVTVNEGGGKTVMTGQGSNHPSPLHNSVRSPHVPNHMQERLKPLPLLSTPPRDPGAFPRQPHTEPRYHVPPSGGRGNRHMDQRRYSLDSQYERREWHNDHNPASFLSPPTQGFSRSLSSGNSHLPPARPRPLINQRRFSEHLEYNKPPRGYSEGARHYNDARTPPALLPTPYRGGGGASRGFRLSDEGARQGGYYREGSTADNRRYSQDDNRRYNHGQYR